MIKARKPGLVIGKGGTVLQKIFAETKWKPVIVREPQSNRGLSITS